MSRALSRKIYAIISSVLLALTTLVVGAPAAHATGVVTFSDPEYLDQSGQTPVRQYDTFGVRWEWTAPNGVNNGDSFTVSFDSANVEVVNTNFPLNTAANEKAGDCVAAGKEITCTFNGTLVAKQNVNGFVQIIGKATQAQDSTDVPMNFNGQRKVLTLPTDGSGKGIVGRQIDPPVQLEKSGWQEEGKGIVKWEIRFPGKILADANRLNQPLVIKEKLTPGNGAPAFQLGEVEFFRQFSSEPQDLIPAHLMTDPRFNFDGNATINQGANTITITPNGGFQADKNYVMWYTTLATADVEKGQTIDNLATFVDVNAEIDAKEVTLVKASAGGNGINQPQPPAANGTFKVKKKTIERTADGQFLDLNVTKDFQVDYTCTKDNAEVKKSSLTVTSNGATVDGPADIPQGATCVFTEPENKTDGSPNRTQPVDGFSLNSYHLQVEGGNSGTLTELPVTIGADVPTILVSNKYERNPNPVGKFKIVKKINDPDKVAPAGQKYTFNWECSDAQKTPFADGTAEISGEGEWESKDFPAGTTCEVTENPIDGLQENNITLAVDVSGAATIENGVTKPVTVTNTFAKNIGTFTITKKVNDPANVVPAGKEFTFNYVCTDPKDNTKKVEDALKVAAGKSATSKEIPAGYSCVITETGAEVANADWAVIGLENVTIVKGQTKEVSVTNTYTQWVGSVRLSKELAGSAAELDVAKQKTFSVDYVCKKGDTTVKDGKVEVSATKPAVITDVPVGAACSFTENIAGAQIDKLQFVENKSTTTVKAPEVTAKDGSVEATLVNHYDALGAVKINKELLGSAAQAAALKSKTFPVNYVCKLGDTETAKGKVEVSADKAATIDGVPAGSVCTFTEDTTGAKVEGLSFVEEKSVVSATAPVAKINETVETKVSNHYDELGAVVVRKEVTGRAAGSSDNNTSKEYTIVATWTVDGVVGTDEFKLKDGETHELPKLPVGTVITLKEMLPNGDAFTSWSTPGYSSDTAGAVTDNRDGTATVSVQKDSIASATLVKVTNTANIPWYWLIIPFVPLVPLLPKPHNPTPPTPPTPGQCIPIVPGQPTPENPNNLPPCGCVPGQPNVPAKPGEPSVPCECVPTAPGMNGANGHNGAPAKGIPCEPQKGVPAKGTPKAKVSKKLANTGASVIGLGALALITVAAGTVLVVRSRRS